MLFSSLFMLENKSNKPRFAIRAYVSIATPCVMAGVLLKRDTLRVSGRVRLLPLRLPLLWCQGAQARFMSVGQTVPAPVADSGMSS